MSDDLLAAAKRIEVLLAATQIGRVEAFEAWLEVAGLLTPIFNELRAYRAAVPTEPTGETT